jgi:Flp pilus assembly pilin Flp
MHMFLNLFIRAQSALVRFRSRFEDEDGVVAVEYITILVLIALAIAGGAAYLGGAINDKLNSAGDAVTACC